MSDFKTLLPPSTTPTARAIEQVMSERLVGLDVPIGQLWNVDTCPEALLPWLAWAFSVEVWDHTWPEATKRAVIRASISVHRWKGTRRSIEDALAALGFEADIQEWFEGEGEETSRVPGTFQVISILPEGEIIGGDQFARSVDAAKRVIDATKPVSAHYGFTVGQRVLGVRRIAARAFGRVADVRVPRVVATTAAPRRARAALVGHIRTASPCVMLPVQRRAVVAVFGKLEAI